MSPAATIRALRKSCGNEYDDSDWELYEKTHAGKVHDWLRRKWVCRSQNRGSSNC